MIRNIVIYPDPRLGTPCDPVQEFATAELRELVADMYETMYASGGLGLAAPQIGVLKQVAVIDSTGGKDPAQKIVILNPVIREATGTQCGEEGCLSFPSEFEKVSRCMNVVVEARDETGAPIHFQAEGLLSRAFQHEIDHLNGVVFIKRMSALKREMMLRRIRKRIRLGDWG